MMRYFSDKSYIWSLLLQSLNGLACLNQHGQYHGDINPNNVVIRFNDEESNSFRIQLMDSLHIKELVELALSEVRKHSEIIVYSKKCPRPTRKGFGRLRNGREGGYMVTWSRII
jgi:serine/threonine protein kinase